MSRGYLLPLAPLYQGLVIAKNAAYDRGWLQPKRLQWPVISVGNLSVGGSGKTPLVIRLAELLRQRGILIDVLSRGYGRQSTATEIVDPSGTADRFGDEPLLIARRTGVRVIVGARRYEAGLLAEAQSGAGRSGVHLLDDGFQHRKLARSVDVVILHRTDLDEKLLPVGRLREPLNALHRATFVVLREEDFALEPELRRLGISAPVWWMRRSLELPGDSRHVIAFCGIARPEEFFAALASRGATLLRSEAFPDHHRYRREDMERLARIATEQRADSFITTEKDEVKLGGSLRAILEHVAPLRVAKLSVELRNEEAILQAHPSNGQCG